MSDPPAFGPLVSADELAALIDEGGVRVIDMRWSLADRGGGRARYGSGHIPGAVFVDLDQDVTGAEGAGRHPLPTRAQLETAMRRAGVNTGDRVVVYDDSGGSSAGRLWWLLRAHGHEPVAILDGGLQAWTGALEQGSAHPDEGTFVARDIDASMWVDADAVGKLGPGVVLIDARAPERYAGETEPVDPVAGHIPGARNAFWQDNLGPGGTFLGPDELRARYEALGVGAVNTVVYCGSGINACHDIIAVERAGLGPARLYAGSWSDWCTRPGAPIETGADE